MRYLTVHELIELHQRLIEQSGGSPGWRDSAGLDSAAVQPQMSFGGQELYPTLADKAATLSFSLIMNHPFVDGNKRLGHAALETFLVLNGHELTADVGEQERIILGVAAGKVGRDPFTEWVRDHSHPRGHA